MWFEFISFAAYNSCSCLNVLGTIRLPKLCRESPFYPKRCQLNRLYAHIVESICKIHIICITRLLTLWSDEMVNNGSRLLNVQGCGRNIFIQWCWYSILVANWYSGSRLIEFADHEPNTTSTIYFSLFFYSPLTLWIHPYNHCKLWAPFLVSQNT